MVSFLTQNKKSNYPLNFLENQIFGRVGFSIDSNSIKSILGSLSSFILENGYEVINIAGDGSHWSEVYINDYIVPLLDTYGIFINKIAHPITVTQLAWFNTQTKKKNLGVFIGRDSQPDDFLSFIFFNELGRPINSKQLKQILSYNSLIITKEFDVLKNKTLENLNLDLYLKYLYDTNLIGRSTSSNNLSIDTMYGSYVSIAEVLKKIPGINLKYFNDLNDAPRLNNYIPKPTGSALRWYTTYRDVASNSFFFGIDGDGDSLGVFDLQQQVEISSSGVALLLIDYLVKVKKVKNLHVLYSYMCGSKIKQFCKKLKVKCTEVEPDLTKVVKYKEDDNFIFYVDETGRFYFNESYIWSNTTLAMLWLVELSNVRKLQLGDILDTIYGGVLKVKFYHNSMFILMDVLNLEDIVTNKEFSDFTVKNYENGSVLTSQDSLTRVSLKENLKDGIIEVFIESKDDQKLQLTYAAINKIINQHVKRDI